MTDNRVVLQVGIVGIVNRAQRQYGKKGEELVRERNGGTR